MPPKRKASGDAEAGPSKIAKTSSTSNNNEQASASPTAATAPQDDSAGQNPTTVPAPGQAQDQQISVTAQPDNQAQNLHALPTDAVAPQTNTASQGSATLPTPDQAQDQQTPTTAQPDIQAQAVSQDGHFVADGIRYNSPPGTQATFVLPNQRSAQIWSPLTVLPYDILEPVPRRFTRQAAAAEKVRIGREHEVRLRLVRAASFAARRLFSRIRHLKRKDGAFQGGFCKEATDPKAACLAYLQPSDSLWEINEEGHPVHEDGTLITDDEMKQAGYDLSKEKHGVESLIVDSDIKFRIACNQPKDTSSPAAELPEHLRNVHLTIRRLPASCTKHSCEAAGFFLETDQLVATKLNGQLLSQLQPQAGSKAPYLYGPLIGFNVIEFYGLPIFFWRSPKDRAYKIEPGTPAGDAADPKSKDDTVPEKDYNLVHELLVPVVADAGAETSPPDVPAHSPQESPQGSTQQQPQEPPQDQPSTQANSLSTLVSKADLEKLNCVLRAQSWPVLKAPENAEEETIEKNPCSHYEAGLFRWRNAFRQYGGKSFETTPWNEYLTDDHCFLAIAAVTEAITQWGAHEFGVAEPGCTISRVVDEDAGYRATRPRKPLLLPVLVKHPDEVHNHFFLAIVHIREQDPKQRPQLLWFDSATEWAHGPNKDPEVLRSVRRWINYLQWSRPGSIGDGTVPELRIRNMPAAQQTNGDSCGIHTILNAWAWCIALRPNPSFVADTAFYKAAAEIIDLAIAGYMDFWTIYAFLKCKNYVLGKYDMTEQRHFPVTRGFRNTQDLVCLFNHIRHVEDVEAGFALASDEDPYVFNQGAQDGMIPLITTSSSQGVTAAGVAPAGLEAPPVQHDVVASFFAAAGIEIDSGPGKDFMRWFERTEKLVAKPQGGT